ncbi:MAG: ribonuclease P protein component [Candidatus Pacebacteria bacterium]|nr:ribonuclease P protein component [Candidatus Paceibacterota bacterium]
MTVNPSPLPFVDAKNHSVPLAAMVKRADFLRMNSTRYKHHAAGFVLLARPRGFESDLPLPSPLPRIGYTASRKVGGAVERNRAKRRLRALVAEVMAGRAAAHWDFVLIAREVTVTRRWSDLRDDLERGIVKLCSAVNSQDGQPRQVRTRLETENDE